MLIVDRRLESLPTLSVLSRLRTGMRVAAHAQRRVSSAAHPRLVDARSETDSGEVVTLRWDDGAQASFHRLWLRDNCVSTRHESSRQKLTGEVAGAPRLRAGEAQRIAA